MEAYFHHGIFFFLSVHLTSDFFTELRGKSQNCEIKTSQFFLRFHGENKLA